MCVIASSAPSSIHDTTMSKPDSESPPPSYTVVPDQDQPSSSYLQPSASPTQPAQHVYGPTPIPDAVSQGGLLPYYDPQSEYARREAVSRARWRFLKAFLWAMAIWVGVGIITGGIAVDVRMSRR